MTEETAQRMLLVTMIASLASFALLAFAVLGQGITGLAVGGPGEPICLWQISGAGRDVNQLVSDPDLCARLTERYASEGECSGEAGTFMVQDVRGSTITWEYWSTCYYNTAGKRFSVLAGQLA